MSIITLKDALVKAKKEKRITVEEYNQEYSTLSQIVKKLEQDMHRARPVKCM